MKQILLFLSFTLIMFSCKKGEVDCVDTDYTYETEAKDVIDRSCATFGCHNAGSSNGDFTTYDSMKTYLDNGSFENRVFIVGDMPKNRIITFKNKGILQCWMENGFKEK